jgi:hypothetical protein
LNISSPIFETDETVTSMQTALPNKVPVCVIFSSATNSQNVLPISIEPSLSALSILHPSDNSPEEIIASRHLNQIRLVPDMPTKYSTPKKQLYFLSMKNLIVLRKSETSKAGIMSQNREIENVNSPKKSGIQGQKMEKIQTGIHNQEALEDSERKCSECWEKYLQTTNEERWIECVSCRNCCPSFVLHAKTNVSTGVDNDCQQKTAKCRRECRKFRSLQPRLSSVGSSIIYL